MIIRKKLTGQSYKVENANRLLYQSNKCCLQSTHSFLWQQPVLTAYSQSEAESLTSNREIIQENKMQLEGGQQPNKGWIQNIIKPNH